MKLKTTSLLIAGTLFGAAMLPAQANNEAMADLLKSFVTKAPSVQKTTTC
ncbi:hypothetical protein [Shewanella glacialipiscicola]|nr:hypothetical protein [Shewanella glacialipiscicola]